MKILGLLSFICWKYKIKKSKLHPEALETVASRKKSVTNKGPALFFSSFTKSKNLRRARNILIKKPPPSNPTPKRSDGDVCKFSKFRQKPSLDAYQL